MSDHDDTNRGVLFPERDKESARHPDYTGKLDIDGTEYRLERWKRKGKTSGKPFLSLKVSPADEHSARLPDPTPPPEPAMADLDDEIPF